MQQPNPNAIPPEHRFGRDVTLEQWEEQVFANANHFTIFRRLGRFNHDTKTVATFPEAINEAKGDRTALVYAVTLTGRSVCLIRARWPRYLEIWNEGAHK
jgi:hypothetical protein